ncbi:hypothetical protein AVEN_203453-1 [Araneus ventricosus]|uniref:Uncharacterized protein n=1 Tax=Araneus ventricosus TaxID=182803 RepID=A0A4Y2BHU4_ARAVE|nr:hypothetical protein AVEN_203453-1 [Araneus ventricosus]
MLHIESYRVQKEVLNPLKHLGAVPSARVRDVGAFPRAASQSERLHKWANLWEKITPFFIRECGNCFSGLLNVSRREFSS